MYNPQGLNLIANPTQSIQVTHDLTPSIGFFSVGQGKEGEAQAFVLSGSARDSEPFDSEPFGCLLSPVAELEQSYVAYRGRAGEGKGFGIQGPRTVVIARV